MLNNIPVTVLMTVYNCRQYILTSVNSILRQTYVNFELLIIDDGSEDNSEEIIKSLNSEKIKYIKLKHLGRSAALNYGLKEAKYDWVALMDSDDRSEEHTSELQSLRHLVCRLLLEKKK